VTGIDGNAGPGLIGIGIVDCFSRVKKNLEECVRYVIFFEPTPDF
jgi:hypothetical protein